MVAPPPPLLATDLEGILLPEIWIAVADRTGIPELRLTTRDVADYDELMRMRIGILEQHHISVHDIQSVTAEMDVLPGAEEFLHWTRSRLPLIIITDSFYEMLAPFLPKLGYATIFAHRLLVDTAGTIVGYRLRLRDGKRKAMQSFSELGFRTMAVGDSYNDITMLQEADHGVLFRPSATVCRDYPELPVTRTYQDVQDLISIFIDAG